MSRFLRGSLVALLALVGLAPGSAPALAQVHVARVVPHHRESPHPYPAGHESMPEVWIDEIRSPGATFIRIHFSEFNLADGDRLTISDPDGGQRHEYSGRGPRQRGEFWAFSVRGDTIRLSLTVRGPGGHGYVIDQIAEGFRPRSAADAENICGDDGRVDAPCLGEVAKRRTRPVARLLFLNGPFLSACTGWLVRGPNDSTMITNNHCIDDQAGVDSLEATFNFQHRACGGAVDDPTFEHAGELLLHTSVDLDYTLLTLSGNPAMSGAGEYVATTLDPRPGRRIVFPQHPGGNQKEIGLWSDLAHTEHCRILSTHQTYSTFEVGSQFNYDCDSGGGASGSPILDVRSVRAWGLHHLGSVTTDPCSNGATHMSSICADAGSLLDCAAD